MKKMVKTLLGLGLALLLLAAALPSLLSTQYGRDQIVRAVNTAIPGEISLDHLRLSWFGPNSIEGLQLKSSANEEVISIEKFHTESSLFAILLQKPVLQNTILKGMNLFLDQNALNEALGHNAPDLNFPAGMNITLQDVEATLREEADEIHLMVSGKTERENLSGQFSINTQVLEAGVHFKAKIESFPVELVDAVISAQYPSMAGMSRTLIGDTLNLDIDQTFSDEEINFLLNAASSKTNSLFRANLKDGILSTEEPGVLTWQDPNGLQGKLTLSRFQTPVSFFSERKNGLETPSIQAQMTMQFANPIETSFGQARMIQMEAAIIDGKNPEKFDLSFDLQMLIDDSPFNLQFMGSMNKPRHISELISDLSLELVFQDLRYPPMQITFGENLLSGKIQMGDFAFLVKSDLTYEEMIRGTVDLAVKGPDLKAKLALIIDEEIRLKRGSDLRMKIPASLLNALYGQSSIFVKGKWDPDEIATFLQPVDIHAKINSFSASQDHSHLALDAELNIANVSMQAPKSREQIDFPLLTASIRSQDILEGMDFAMTILQKEGKFHLNGKAKGETVSLSANASHFFAAPLVRLITFSNDLGNLIETLYGNALDANFNLGIDQMNGQLAANITGANGSFHMDGQIQDGNLTLNQPLTASVQFTPLLVSQLIDLGIPVLNELIQADAPITLEVLPEKFSMPLFDFDIKNIEMSQATIHLGRLHFKNHGEIQSVLSLLNANPADTVSILFTPLYVYMEQGTLHVWRMDMLLADAYPLATWGKIDFVKDKVSMIAAISGTALNKAFGTATLKPSSFMQIPIKGAIAKARIDKNLAAARIGAVMAKSQGSAEGFVVGTLLDLAKGKEAKVPEPTTNPLPWNLETENHSESISPGVIKQFEKGAKSLLKKIIN